MGPAMWLRGIGAYYLLLSSDLVRRSHLRSSAPRVPEASSATLPIAMTYPVFQRSAPHPRIFLFLQLVGTLHGVREESRTATPSSRWPGFTRNKLGSGSGVRLLVARPAL